MEVVREEDFSHDLIAAVADQDEAPLTAALDHLLASGLVFRRGSPPDAVYTFKHALVQDEAYESLLRRRRRQLHLRIAETIETAFADRAAAEPELLAHHFTEANEIEKAVTYWGRGGQRSIEMGKRLV